MGCPLECLVICHVLGGRRQWARVSGGRAQARSDCAVPSFRSRVLQVRDPHAGEPVSRRVWRRPAFCFGGWRLASWKTWAAALCWRLRSPAQRHTAAWGIISRAPKPKSEQPICKETCSPRSTPSFVAQVGTADGWDSLPTLTRRADSSGWWQTGASADGLCSMSREGGHMLRPRHDVGGSASTRPQTGKHAVRHASHPMSRSTIPCSRVRC